MLTIRSIALFIISKLKTKAIQSKHTNHSVPEI
jgi:hypothetical protein